MATIKHPAKFSDVLIEQIDKMVVTHSSVLDPFAGVGTIHKLHPRCETYGIEIEPEWANMHPRTIVGNALDLPFSNDTFDYVVTSPCYGNRMADHHNAKDSSRRMTYTHTLGRTLHDDNSGKMQWGKEYRSFHNTAWMEVRRVLKPYGNFILNISDHIRKGERVPVTSWHIETLRSLGFIMVNEIKIPTPRMRFGQNHAARIEYESIIEFVV